VHWEMETPFTERSEDNPRIAEERAYRHRRWTEFLNRTIGHTPKWRDVQENWIFRPQGQGIWADVDRTRNADAPAGIGYSILLTDVYGEQAPSEERFIYHYPTVQNRRSENEIESIKTAKKYDMPMFLVDGISLQGSYIVRIVWVIDWDDQSRTFLFGFSLPTNEERENEDIDQQPYLEIRDRTMRGISNKILRPGQREFAFDVFKRYGPKCAFCDMDVCQALDACHIRPFKDDGPDDARNGLVICKSHHSLFDAGIICIEPEKLKIGVMMGMARTRLHIKYASLVHLRKQPAVQAISWRFSCFKLHISRKYEYADE
jgi:putative restriction endonuclease